MKNLIRIFVVLAITLTYSCKKEKSPQPMTQGGGGTPTPTGTVDHSNVEVRLNMSLLLNFNPTKNGTVYALLNDSVVSTHTYSLPKGIGSATFNIGHMSKGDRVDFIFDVGVLSNGNNIPAYDTILTGNNTEVEFDGAFYNFNRVAFYQDDSIQPFKTAFKQMVFGSSTPVGQYTADSTKYTVYF